jgi:alkylation response protein AidB-like acyl-CoA dehydrogenase
MDFPFSEEHRIFRRSVRRFVDEEIIPYVNEWEEAGIFPKELYKKMGARGFLGIRYPQEYGGAASDIWSTVVFCEELGRCRSRGLAMSVLVHTDMSSPYLAKFGSELLKKKFLSSMVSGDKVGAIALTEPNGGSDLASLKTIAKKKDGHYVLTGSKVFITNSLNADLFFTVCRTGTSNSHRDISMIVVERNTPGFEIRKLSKKLGMHASDTGELSFDQCKVPLENLIGEEGQGFYYSMQGLQNERFVSCASFTESAQQALDDAIKYSQEREAFGRKVSEFQVTKHKLAKLQTKLVAARQLLYHAARLIEAGEDTSLEISMCKAFCADVACDVADECLQIHGGYGYIEEYDIARFYRDIRLWKIGAGTTEVMYEIIAKRLNI